ncbi:hypothetical protein D3C76_941790 [compost metagenome]
MARLPPQHPRTKGLGVRLAVGRSREGQGDCLDRVLIQPAGQQFAAQHAADADHDVIGHGPCRTQAAAVVQAQFHGIAVAHHFGLEVAIEKRKELDEVVAGAFQGGGDVEQVSQAVGRSADEAPPGSQTDRGVIALLCQGPETT